MSGRLNLRWVVGAALLSSLAGAPAYGVAVGDVRAQIEAGKQAFATNCANCHGAGGKGAIGPKLIDTNLAPEAVRSTVLNGRVGTPMPPFKDELDPQSQAVVIAYVIFLSSSGHLPTAPIPIEAATAASAVSNTPVAVGNGKGIPARGAALFFDATHLYSCRSCHSFSDKGGPVGPDLAKAPRTPEEVYAQLTRARLASSNYPALNLRLRNGSSLQGVRADETSAAFVLFDVTSLPPVKRTVDQSEVKEAATPAGGVYDHTQLPFSKQDCLDLAAYLGQRH